MPERRGDKSIEERINEGDAQLSDFFPDDADTGRDMVTALKMSAMRVSLYEERRLRPQHTESSREGDIPRYLMEAADTPNYVINNPIKVDGKPWNYKTNVRSGFSAGFRRVFIERNQAIELAVDVTLEWLSTGKGNPKYEETKKLLEEESSLPENEVLMQVMYDRIKSNPPRPMIDGTYEIVPYSDK